MNKSRNEIPTIDVNLVTVTTRSGKEFGFETANQVEVEVQTEDSDAVRLVVKGKLIAQKPQESTITGHQLTLHDNVFNPELIKVLQGGTVYYWQDEARTTMGTLETDNGFAKYTPPVAGSGEKGEIFTLNCYSAIYNAAGVITGYEKTMYPNCQGVPVAFNSEDGSFRAPEYTINSAPDTGESPYEVQWVSELPSLYDPDMPTVTITAVENQSTTYSSGSTNTYDLSNLFTFTPSAGIGAKTYEITGGDNIGTITEGTSTLTYTGTGSITVKVTVADSASYIGSSKTNTLTITAA